jgi:hypothetical protein
MIIIPKRMTFKEWSEVWFDKITPIQTPTQGSLMIYQVMKGRVQFENKFYEVVAWRPPTGKPYVEVTQLNDN